MNEKATGAISVPFVHRQSAHCETGVLSNLLSHKGLEISEAMVFGIGGGLFFGYFPFVRLNKLPLTAYRSATGSIMKKATKRLGVELKWEKFRSPEKAMNALDRRIEEGNPVGCRAGAYWLDYFPPRYRFHFNMHNLIVYGKRNSFYAVSDPVLPDPVECSSEVLRKARFAKGPMPPKGKMYHVVRFPKTVDWKSCIHMGIRDVCRIMLNTPIPLIGTRGMRFLASRLVKWPHKMSFRDAVLHLGQIIRMQEEIGTGGAGFRFIFAAFLQEAGGKLEDDRFQAFSEKMTTVGDRWREFAVVGSRICKKRNAEEENFEMLADLMKDCASQEEELYRQLISHIEGR